MSATATPPERRPVTITITAAGKENIVLRSLIRQAIPMILQPYRVSKAQREQLANVLLAAISHPEENENDDTADADETSWFDDDNECEPGCREETWQ